MGGGDRAVDRKAEQRDESPVANESGRETPITAVELWESDVGRASRGSAERTSDASLPQFIDCGERASEQKRETTEGSKNQWKFDRTTREGIDRLTLRSAYEVKEADFLAANPALGGKVPEPGGEKQFKLRHPTTGQIDDCWKLVANEKGVLRLERDYEVEVQSKDKHDGLLESMPGVPASFEKQLQKKLDEIPENVKESLARHGYKIIAARTIPDAIPELETLTPRGWPDDMTFYNSDGTHDDVSKRIIAPLMFDNNGDRQLVYREDVLTHQIGHALDFAHGFLSAKPEFVDAYDKDMARLKGSRDRRVQYLSQADGVGRQETFAALFGLVLTGPENESDRDFLKQSFPSVLEVVKNQIKELK